VIQYVVEDSLDGARHVLRQALAAARSLEALAERGRTVPELEDPQIREIFVFRYRLIYRVEADRVSILAFIHGARDFVRWRRGE
jgi:plasmid stabilization system protein ParE